MILTDDSLLVVNHREVIIAGRPAGSVVTLRDRTEMEGLIRELDSATGLAKALRAQEHEFANRLHVIGGLLDLQEFAEARSYVNAVVTSGHTGTGEDLRARISPPIIAALLLAKQTIAAERDIILTIAEHSRLEMPGGAAAQNLMTVLGNLIDNATRGSGQPGTAAVRRGDHHGRRRTGDRRAGQRTRRRRNARTQHLRRRIHHQDRQPDRRRGIGLALVRRLVRAPAAPSRSTRGPELASRSDCRKSACPDDPHPGGGRRLPGRPHPRGERRAGARFHLRRAGSFRCPGGGRRSPRSDRT